MKVGGVCYGCREDTLAVLALGLAVELFPPLCEIGEFRIVNNEDFDCLAVFAMKKIAHCSVLYGRVFCAAHAERLPLVGSTLKHSANVESGNYDRKKSYRSQDAVAASDIVRNDE